MGAKRKLALILAVVMALGIFAGCSNNAADANAEILTIAYATDVQALEPSMQNDAYSGVIVRHVYDNLIEIDENLEYQPKLATGWEFSEDGMDITFHLREGVSFHNGEKFKAEDVVYTIDRLIENGKYAARVDALDYVEVVDDYTVIFHLSEPSVSMLENLGSETMAIISKEYTENLLAQGKTLEDAPNGTGPYTFVEWKPAASVELKANKDYWNKDRVPKNGGILMKIIPEEASRTIALETGEVDLLCAVPTVDVDSLKEIDTIDVIQYTTGHMEYMIFNQEKEPFDNLLVRQAVSHCLNREDYVQVVWNYQALPNYTYVGLASGGFTEDVTIYEYDLEKAKALLVEAGYPDGFAFTANTSTDTRNRGLQVLQAALRQIGVDMEIEQNDTAAFLETVANHDHYLATYGYTIGGEPDYAFTSMLSDTAEKGNIAGYSNPEVDALIAQARVTIDYDERMAIYAQVQKLCSDDAVWIPCVSRYGILASQTNVKGIIAHPSDNHRFEQVYIED